MSESQKEIFLRSEGDAWFLRNAAPFDPVTDPVLEALASLRIRPQSVLEVGCGRGGRLAALRQLYSATCCGIEPSSQAINHIRLRHPEIHVKQGTADALPFPSESFDLVIFGFCLYLCEPREHFAICAEANRVLRDNGFLVIHDFIVPAEYANEYRHFPGLRSYKMQWSKMFCSHPSYRLLSRRYDEHQSPYTFKVDEAVGVDILLKELSAAFPLQT